jgi:hypothetical protein
MNRGRVKVYGVFSIWVTVGFADHRRDSPMLATNGG